jgi:hypothetical protein
MMTGILNLVALIVLFGVLMWIINSFIPMPEGIKTLLNVVVLIVLIVYVLQFFGLIKTIFPMINLFK